MRTLHRLIAPFVVLVTLYLGLTGTLIQSIDLRTLTTTPADPARVSEEGQTDERA